MEREYFLGASSAEGFYSLYDELYLPEIKYLGILKGGPGNGKSTFLRMIAAAAEERGYRTERILCASDPGSLDGVILPELGYAWADGTAPHTLDARLPGARDVYIDLGVFYDHAALARNAGEIREAGETYADLKRRAGLAIRTTGAAYAGMRREAGKSQSEKLVRRGKGVAMRLIPHTGTNARLNRRILSAIAQEGAVTLWNTVLGDCERVCELQDSGGRGSVFLESLHDTALSRGAEVCVCYNPLLPGTVSHVILPECGTAFVTTDAVFRLPRQSIVKSGVNLRRMKLDTPLTMEDRRERRLVAELADRAGDMMAKAKSAHDELEALYNPHVDFEGVKRRAEEEIERKLGK